MAALDDVPELDEDPELELVVAAGDVSVIFDPSGSVIDVVVEPSLLVTVLAVAPAKACSSASELEPLPEPLLPPEPLDPLAPPEPPTWAW